VFLTPSDWIVRWSHMLEPGTAVLDVACGSGRHLAWFSDRGHPVTGIDIDIDSARRNVKGAELIAADIEGSPWPLCHGTELRQFGAVVVTNYLWRPLWETLIQSIAPGGVFLYETFSVRNAAIGRPSRPDFLLRPRELLDVCSDMQVIAYEDGYLQNPPRFVQRIAAVQPSSAAHPNPESHRCALWVK
jgi:SAM-dependent methyltransferase